MDPAFSQPPPPPEPIEVGDERAMLESWLEFHRQILVRKCGGLTPEQLTDAACPPSPLTLLGLLRHMTDVEQGWFERGIGRMGKEPPFPDVVPHYWSDDDPDGDLRIPDPPDPAGDLARYEAQLERSRAALAAVATLDLTVTDGDRTISARWVLVHMVEEYARHNGHADLLRERIDGQTGD
ncbi:MAG: DinB family protein [Actinobacteria bacterium]|nr:DinB family protein [Actinomycetota bacterium]